MHNLKRKANLLYFLSFLSLSNIIAQSEPEMRIEMESCGFLPIELGAHTFYQHRIVGIMMDEKMHRDFCKFNHHPEELHDPFSFTSLERSRVNPYRGAPIPERFRLLFDQNKYKAPIDRKMIITSRYGIRHSGPHRGIDIDLITGDTVRTMLPGKVRFVGYSKGHGKTIVVRHTNEVETLYAHLSDHLVEENQWIAAGQAIGLGGNTGNSRGSHLHLEVRYKGITIHPEYVFDFDESYGIAGRELWVFPSVTTPYQHSSYRKSNFDRFYSEEEILALQNSLPKYHVVQKGDTLSHIARVYRTEISEICTLNDISKQSVLSIGQIIKCR